MCINSSSIWDLGDYCQEKQSKYQKMGILGRWQVCPSDLEPPQKRIKGNEIDLVGVKQMKVKRIYKCLCKCILVGFLD